jgi:hypothetical protein
VIYRVTKRTTGSVQPGRGQTFWNRETLYCGTSLEDARVAYLAAKNGEEWCGYGNRACEIDVEQFESEPEEIDSAEASAVEEVE